MGEKTDIIDTQKKFMITGGSDGSIRMWEVKSRELVSEFKEHKGEITGLEIFDDDFHLISCSKDKSIFCWDLKVISTGSGLYIILDFSSTLNEWSG